jgi:hypothetical protein
MFAIARFIIGIGCPGMIQPDGSIDRGAQNLPSNWESSRFNLPLRIHDGERSLLLGNAAAAWAREGTWAQSAPVRRVGMPMKRNEARHTNDNFIALIRDSMARPEHKLFEIRSG